MFLLNQEINPATTSYPKSKSKPRIQEHEHQTYRKKKMNITKSKSKEISKNKNINPTTHPFPNQTIIKEIPQQVNNLENRKKFQNAKFLVNAKTKSPANPKPQMSRNDHRSDQQQQQTLQSQPKNLVKPSTHQHLFL